MAASTSEGRHGFLSRLLVFIFLFVFWVIFSGVFDAFHLSLGVICCGLVTLMSHDLLISDFRCEKKMGKTVRFILYLPWLIYQIILANLHVVRMVIQPSKIKPQIIKIEPALKSDLSRVLLANSITLTPGTITMDIEDGVFYVHALSQPVADDLLSGDMERRVARVFYED
jgi:multicomponent Na+:H+ antiporter subunit E